MYCFHPCIFLVGRHVDRHGHLHPSSTGSTAAVVGVGPARQRTVAGIQQAGLVVVRLSPLFSPHMRQALTAGILPSGAGYSTSRYRGEIVSNAYVCLPRYEIDAAHPVGGVELSIAARGSVPNDSGLVQVQGRLQIAMQRVLQYVLSDLL